ncbi:MAG TPA: amidase family protein [Opitutaceae bacterium]
MHRLLRLTALAFALAQGVSLVPSAGLRAATFDLSTATIADINAAIDAGALTSEKLVSLYLARIAAYDKKGPALNTIITLNPKALDEARALDAERKQKGPRSPLHGVPVILKDNFDTTDLPTTAGCVFLAGSLPPTDAFVTAKLRAAGAIILAKANTSEFALSGKSNGFSSLGGQTLNPHDLSRGPAGSSGGSGAALAAWFAPLAFGSDTGGSVRGPSAANGIPGLKPSLGSLSRAGIVPLALSFDTGGPMARNVSDLALVMNFVTGVDPRDPVTADSKGKLPEDFTAALKPEALKGARFGVLRDFLGADAEVDAVIESAIATLKAQGATVTDVTLPDYVLKARSSLFSIVRMAEFKAQITDYLQTLGPGYPKSHAELVKLADAYLADPAGRPGVANAARWEIFHEEAEKGKSLTDPEYLAARDQGLALIRDTLAGILASRQLDAFIYPTSLKPALPLKRDYSATGPDSATNLANFSGFPDAIVPAGVTKDRLPVTLSFLGPRFSEAQLLGYAYAFEQATHARVAPASTPALPGERFSY